MFDQKTRDSASSLGHAVCADAGSHRHRSHASASQDADRQQLLRVEGLTVGFNRYDPTASFFSARRQRLEVLRGLSFSVRAGEVLALVGASGSGKTVLADALLGLSEINAQVAGKIWFDGVLQDALSLAALRGRQIVLVPQTVTHLDPLMRVGRQVQGVPRGATPADRRRDRDRRAARQRELFDRYGLAPEVADFYPHQLSGGMARRVLLMCALMESPRLIIADEPTPGMDLERAVRAVDDLRAFANAGGGVLLITHDVELARRVADRIAVFSDGTIIQETAAADFPTSAGGGLPPHDAFSKEVLRARDICFAYGDRQLFSDVNLTVRAGERVALTGHSGVGKTTLCKILAGQMRPESGWVEVPGPSGRQGRSANPVQLVPQHPEHAFDPRMRMGASLAEAGHLGTDYAQRLMDRLLFNRQWLDRLPHELSGGELTRSALLRALLARPRVLICDESTAMLDARTQMRVWRSLADIAEEVSMGIVFVSHSPALISQVATSALDLEAAVRERS